VSHPGEQAPGIEARAPAPSALTRVSRAARLGLAGGTGVGGAFLAGSAARGARHPESCTGLTQAECALVRGSAHRLLRLQGGAALGLLLLALALLLSLRRRVTAG